MTEKRFAVVATALAVLLLGSAAVVGAAVAPAPVNRCWSTAEYTCPPSGETK